MFEFLKSLNSVKLAERVQILETQLREEKELTKLQMTLIEEFKKLSALYRQINTMQAERIRSQATMIEALLKEVTGDKQ